MRLRDLANVDSDSAVTGFAIDHRKVAPGSVLLIRLLYRSKPETVLTPAVLPLT